MSEIKGAILKRKSVRKYKFTDFSDTERAAVLEIINNAPPLYKGIETEVLLLKKEEYDKVTGGMFIVSAPYYLIIKSDRTDGYLLNAGFIGQNIALKLAEINIGACWLGGAKSKEKDKEQEMPYVISMAVGIPDEPFRKNESEASRKSIFDIAYGCTDAHLSALTAARLAPSAMNKQPVRYKCLKDALYVFRKKPLIDMLSKMQIIDCGIAIANIIYNEPEYKFIYENGEELAGCEFVGKLCK